MSHTLIENYYFTTKKSNIRNLKDLKDKKVTTQKDSLY